MINLETSTNIYNGVFMGIIRKFFESLLVERAAAYMQLERAASLSEPQRTVQLEALLDEEIAAGRFQHAEKVSNLLGRPFTDAQMKQALGSIFNH